MTKISTLPALAEADIDGDETLPVVKNGTTYRAPISQVGAVAAARAEAARAALDVDFVTYCAGDIRRGYIQLSDGQLLAPNDNYRTTPPIRAYNGQIFRVTANVDGFQATVAMWDRFGTYLGAATSSDASDTDVVVSHPDLFAVTFSGRAASPFSASGAKIREPLEMPRGIFPTFLYLERDKENPLFARSMVPDLRFPLAWNDTKSNDRVHPYMATSPTDVLKLSTVLEGGFRCEIAAIPTQARYAPASPSTPVNIICLGDSTTQSTGAQDGAGDYYDWVNELAWQLTANGEDGIADTSKGRRALPDDNGATMPWGLANVVFRGTRGAQTIKHEGRGGWSIRNYLDNADFGGVANPFYNAGFDLGHYLAQQGFDLNGDPAAGVDATGSNLRILIGLGWNDISTRSEAQLIADFEELIDAIRATHPNAKLVLLGHEPPPVSHPIRRTDPGANGRFLTARHVFERYLVPLDRVLRTVSVSRNVGHLPYAALFDSDIGFKSDQLTVVPWDAATYKAFRDYVHAGPVGSYMKARAIRAFLANPGWIS